MNSRRRVNSVVGALSLAAEWNDMRFVLPIICIVTFCIVSVMIVDAVAPLGVILERFLYEEPTPIIVRVLLLVPVAGILLSSLVPHMLTRGILMVVSTLLLIALWVLGLTLFVVYPMPGTRVSYALPLITSVPFVLAVIATMTHSFRTMLAARRKHAI